VCVRFDDDIHIRSDFETSILAFLVSDNVLDANLLIQLVSFLNTDLCFLWFAWKGGLDHLLYLATHLPLPLAHGNLQLEGRANRFYIEVSLQGALIPLLALPPVI